ncbi:Lrp/AsnC family transcriptional regulator [Candidatus Woesearchaeota archaeon]|nr:Lrp/AsnC family transcriptional regulator [Candidatus Woesearchaeota archaeon]
MVFKQKDRTILKTLRNNARTSLTDLSNKHGIPVSTVYERVTRSIPDVVHKFTARLDFAELGFNNRVIMVLSSKLNKRENLLKVLETARETNNLVRLAGGSDFYCEAVFRNMKELEDFLDRIHTMIKSKQVYHVIEDLVIEGFADY